MLLTLFLGNVIFSCLRVNDLGQTDHDFTFNPIILTQNERAVFWRCLCNCSMSQKKRSGKAFAIFELVRTGRGVGTLGPGALTVDAHTSVGMCCAVFGPYLCTPVALSSVPLLRVDVNAPRPPFGAVSCTDQPAVRPTRPGHRHGLPAATAPSQ